MKLLFIINPISGGKSKAPFIQWMRAQLKSLNLSADIVETTKDFDYTATVKSAAESGVTRIVACGGDGTLNAVAQQVKDFPVELGLIPFGSGNGFARSFGISLNPETAFERAVNGQAKEVDYNLLNGRISLACSGLGLDAKAAASFANSKTRGFWGYFVATSREVFKLPTYQLQLTFNGQSLDVHSNMIAIGNGNQFGYNFTITKEADMHDGKATIIVLCANNTLQFLTASASQTFGKKPAAELQRELKPVNRIETAQITLTSSFPIPFHLDGEPMGELTKLEVITVQAGLKVVR